MVRLCDCPSCAVSRSADTGTAGIERMRGDTAEETAALWCPVRLIPEMLPMTHAGRGLATRDAALRILEVDAMVRMDRSTNGKRAMSPTTSN